MSSSSLRWRPFIRDYILRLLLSHAYPCAVRFDGYFLFPRQSRGLPLLANAKRRLHRSSRRLPYSISCSKSANGFDAKN